MELSSMKCFFRPKVRAFRYFKWKLGGKPINDQFGFYKQERFIRIGKKYGCLTFLETGTYYGDSVDAARRYFSYVLSVELSEELFFYVKSRFRSFSNVLLWQGDSAKLMPQMLEHIKGKTLFWLDGHYSGDETAKGEKECPILDELLAISRHPFKNHCILIDDARFFGFMPGYPTMEEVRSYLLNINPDYKITIEKDCIIALA